MQQGKGGIVTLVKHGRIFQHANQCDHIKLAQLLRKILNLVGNDHDIVQGAATGSGNFGTSGAALYGTDLKGIGLAQKTGECAAAATQLQYPGVAQVRRKRSQQIGALR